MVTNQESELEVDYTLYVGNAPKNVVSVERLYKYDLQAHFR